MESFKENIFGNQVLAAAFSQSMFDVCLLPGLYCSSQDCHGNVHQTAPAHHVPADNVPCDRRERAAHFCLQQSHRGEGSESQRARYSSRASS